MNKKKALSAVKHHINMLCNDITERCVGSEGNRKATLYFKNELIKSGWETEETLLEVMDWNTQGASLICDQSSFEVFSSPYSLGCSVQAELVEISSLNELKKENLNEKIALLHGEIAKEQIMPKNFVFYNPETHQHIIKILEDSGVKAIICATGRNAALAGGVYPFPMFEDGDFDIPSVYMKDVEGERLLNYIGKTIRLDSFAVRIPETAYNVIGRKYGKRKDRIVITAHIDAKKDTPGAIDNGTGVAILMLLSEMLSHFDSNYTIELLAFNGEDYYAVSGQMKYIEQNKHQFDDVLLNINIDGAGYKQGLSSFSAFGLPDNIMAAWQLILQKHTNIIEGLPWYQGDHSIFIQHGRPAIAVSSDWFIRHMDNQDITHTPKDNIDIVNFDRLVEIAIAIKDLIITINNQ